MRSKFIFLLSLVILVSWIGVLGAVCYGAGNVINSTTISDGCTLDVAGTYIMSGESFQLNGSVGGAIAINDHNIILDCNGSTLEGNRSEGENSFVGIFTDYDNVTIKNCILLDYDRAIRTFTSAENDTIFNNTINNSNYGIMISYGYANVTSNTIINSTSFSVYLENSNYSIFDNNDGYGATYSYFYLTNSFYNNFTNNNLSRFNDLIFHEAIDLRSSDNNYFYNNTLSNTYFYGFRIEVDSEYNQFINNTVENVDRGFYFNSASYNNITGNLIQNVTTNEDSFNVGVHLINGSNNNLLKDNNISEYGSVGILVMHNSSNNNIFDNYFYGININDRSSYSANDVKDFPCSIKLVKLYKSFLTQSQEGDYNVNSLLNNFSSLNSFINISGNSFSDTDCFLHSEGFDNVTHDLSNYVYRSYFFPTFLSGQTKLWLSNSFNNISRYESGIYNFYQAGYNQVYYGNISQFLDYQYYQNINDTTNYQLNLYNLTNALIYFSNNSVACSDIATCDGNINITLTPNNYSYVLDNFNLTEGTTRANSPVAFSYTSNTEKHINSSLLEPINATVVFNVLSCDTLGTVSYTSDTGTYTQSYSESDYTCTNNVLTLTVNGIETATASNVITLAYNQASVDICDGFDDAASTFITFFVIIIIVSIAGLILFFLLGSGEEVDLNTIAFALIVAGISLSIGATIILRIGGC